MFNFFGKKDREIERLTKLAYYDGLTSLPNRISFQDKMEKLSIACKAGQVGHPIAILLIDLDNFKPVNDTHGHAIGDFVLREIANRLKSIVDSRSEYDRIVARLGGDEFVIMFERLDKPEAKDLANTIINALRTPVPINGVDVQVSASVGMAFYPYDGDDTSSVLKAADLAMYAAKELGKDQYAFHEKSMNTKIAERVELENLIRQIIRTKKIDLSFQPIFDIETDSINGCEALLRGKTKAKTFNPAALIDVAEQSNLIVPLGSVIMQRACEFARDCLDGGHSIKVSVNVSSYQLTKPEFVSDVHDILEATGLPPINLVLEITETALMENFEESSKALTALRDIGVQISIDDFGKGYSSFSYLQRLPINKIKIDMSFIQTLGTDFKTDAIVKGIVLMADALQMQTCAEGVETIQQYTKLKEFGCDQVQGHYKYPALNPIEFAKVLEHEKLSKLS